MFQNQAWAILKERIFSGYKNHMNEGADVEYLVDSVMEAPHNVNEAVFHLMQEDAFSDLQNQVFISVLSERGSVIDRKTLEYILVLKSPVTPTKLYVE